MTPQIIGTYIASVSMIIGAGFVLVGAIGLLKFNDPMTRLHAPTKVGTLGIGMLLVASVIHSFDIGRPSIHEFLIMAFLFATAPISANFIAKVNIHKRAGDTPPPPSEDTTWSTLSVETTDEQDAKT